jgi:hypothetical protein
LYSKQKQNRTEAMNKFLNIFVLQILILTVCSGQSYKYENKVYDHNILTVNLFADNNVTAFQAIELGGGKVTLIFDDLTNNERNFFYKLIHCDRNWQKSDLRDVDFIDGYNDEPIRSFNYSVNTRNQYINYSLSIPNANSRLRISGNYILLIYEENEEKPIITRRFVVTENVTRLDISQIFPSDVENLKYKQEFNVEFLTGQIRVRQPKQEFSLAMVKNEDWNTVQRAEPNFILNDRIKFNKLGTLQWWGLTEYREFDTRSLNIIGRSVDRISRTADGYDVILTPSVSENENFFETKFDFNGRYYIDNYDALSIRPDSEKSNPSVVLGAEKFYNADYANVHFKLQSKVDLYDDEDIYVLGAFNNWTPTDEYKMFWSEKLGMYQVSILLKQGFYNYSYGIVNREGKIKYHTLDGSWAETENDYHAILYFRGISDIYDRVLSVESFNTSAKKSSRRYR